MDRTSEIITRKQAKERGLDYYFTGKPCVHGHLTFKWTINATCSECKKSNQKRYYEGDKDTFLKRCKDYRDSFTKEERYQKKYAEYLRNKAT